MLLCKPIVRGRPVVGVVVVFIVMLVIDSFVMLVFELSSRLPLLSLLHRCSLRSVVVIVTELREVVASLLHALHEFPCQRCSH